MEWRISIYGRSPNEWDKLAKWIVNNKLFSHNVRWLIQVPRIYEVYKTNGSIQTFEDIVTSKHDLLIGLNWTKLAPTKQTYSDLCSKWHRIRKAIPSCMYFCSAWSASTLLMTNPKLKEGFTKSSHILNFGTYLNRLLIHTGLFFVACLTNDELSII